MVTLTIESPRGVRTAGDVHAFPRLSADDAEVSFATLHDRILEGNAEALEQPAARLLSTLCNQLRNSFRHASHEFLVDAVEDAILEYALHPRRFVKGEHEL
jgi:hypothetical protein